MKALDYLCTGCRKISQHKFSNPRRSWVGRCNRCGKRRRQVFFGRRPLTRRFG